MVGFIFGKEGLAATPQDLEQRRLMAKAMIRSGSEKTPQDPWEGIAAVARALSGNYADYKLGQEETAGRKASDENFAKLFGGDSATAEPASYSPATEIDSTRKAFLDTIAGPESGGKYNVMYGGKAFDSFADHPRQAIPISSGPNAGKTSSAAGKYQFLGSTWDQQRQKLNLPDFSPESQDAAAWDLAASNYHKTTGGQLADALAKGDDAGLRQIARSLAPTWTSLPGGIEQTTSDNDFASTFRKNLGAGAQAQPAGAQVAQASGTPDLNSLFKAYSDPWASDNQRDILKLYIAQELKRREPKEPLKVGEGDTLVDPNTMQPVYGGAPKTTDDIREYNFYVEQVKARGGTPLPPEEFWRQQKKAGATNIDTRQMGTVPPGYRAEYDANGNVVQLTPIPGGPAAAEADEKAQAEQNRVAGEQQRGGIVTQDIDRALDVIQNQGLIGGTGWGSVLSNVPGTDAKAIAALLDTVRANIGFEELNKMRQKSPTGGALGQVTERELAFLQAVAGSLDQAQSQEQLTDNLNRLWNSYQDVIHGQGKGPQRRPLKFEQGSPAQPATNAPDADGWITAPNGVRVREKK